MDFLTVTFFLFLYYVRPHDWMPAFEVLRPITLTMGLALLAMLTRPGGWSPRQALRTPHDWGMLIFALWIIGTAPSPTAVWADTKSAFIFYVVTVAALSTSERLARYLQVWTWMLVAVSALAVASFYGLDLTGSQSVTDLMHGRLSLNTYMLNNPNALGHAVVVAIPLLYFLCLWRQGRGKLLGLCALGVVLACVYYTQSKGAYVVGALTLVASMMFGRPKIVQLAVLAVASTIGLVALTQLPRMHELNRSDEGIQGRLIAWEMARTAMRDSATGVGFNGFVAEFRWEKKWVKKAAHSSYVQVGASSGYTGLFLYAGLLVRGFRTVITARPRTEEEERIRRLLFVLLVGFAASGWMVDRANNVEFFIMIAAVGAFHRLLQAPARSAEETAPAAEPSTPGLQPALAFASLSGLIPKPAPLLPKVSPPSPDAPLGLQWAKLGWLDAALAGAALWAIVEFWNRVLQR